MATVGAIAFAALVLVLQDQAPFRVVGVFAKHLSADQNFDALVLLLGIVSMLSIFSSLCLLLVSEGLATPTSFLGIFGFISALGSWTALLGAITDVVWAATPVGGEIIALSSIGLLALLFLGLWLAHRQLKLSG